MERGSAPIGGFTVVAAAVSAAIFVPSLMWVTLSNHASDGSIAAVLASGTTLLASASARVSWHIKDGVLIVRQFVFKRRIDISDVVRINVAHASTWKQGVGTRWVGPKEWAMVCGSRDVISLAYDSDDEQVVFHFSARDANEVVSALEGHRREAGE